MAFKDIFNKGKDMITGAVENAKKAAENKKNAIHEFDLLKTKSYHIGPMSTYTVNNPDPQAGKETSILNVCFTINVENSKVINKLLPIDETILDVKTGKEAKTEIQYALVITDKHLWVTNQNEYKIYPFDTIANFEIVNKGLMSQGVKFDNNAWIIDGSESDVTRFGNLITNSEQRNESIVRRTAYLCGITPVEQLLNTSNRGVTFGKDNKIILHSGTENKLLDIKDIATVQLLVNDTVALSRGREDSGNFVSSPMEARKMSLKFVLAMGEFIVPILEQNMMNTTYKREDSTYITNFDFAKKVIDTTVNYMRGLKTAPVINEVTPNNNVNPVGVVENIAPTPVQNVNATEPAPNIPVTPTTAEVPPIPPIPNVAPTNPSVPNQVNTTNLDPFGIQSSAQNASSQNNTNPQ